MRILRCQKCGTVEPDLQWIGAGAPAWFPLCERCGAGDRWAWVDGDARENQPTPKPELKTNGIQCERCGLVWLRGGETKEGTKCPWYACDHILGTPAPIAAESAVAESDRRLKDAEAVVNSERARGNSLSESANKWRDRSQVANARIMELEASLREVMAERDGLRETAGMPHEANSPTSWERERVVGTFVFPVQDGLLTVYKTFAAMPKREPVTEDQLRQWKRGLAFDKGNRQLADWAEHGVPYDLQDGWRDGRAYGAKKTAVSSTGAGSSKRSKPLKSSISGKSVRNSKTTGRK